MSTFLEDLSAPQRLRLTAAGVERSLADGELLVGKGDLGGDLFLVVSGALEARDGPLLLSVRRPGEVVGEIAFLDGGPRSAALIARGPSSVRVWRRSVLDDLFERDPALRAAVLQGIALAQARTVRQRADRDTPLAAASVDLETGRFVEHERILVRPDGSKVALSPIEARLLAYLAARPGRVLSHRALLDEVWGYSGKVASRTVYATVHRLRGKVEADPTAPRHLVAAAGGYRFEPLTR